jgi:DNA primase
MKKDKINAIKEVANLKIEEIFDALGINYRERYNYIVSTCPVHGGDRADAFSWHLDRGIWKCFSRECEAEFGSDIIGLIRGIKSCSFNESVGFLGRFINMKMNPVEIQRLRDKRENRDFIQAAKKKVQRSKVFNPDCLTRLKQHTYLETRGYPRWLIEKYHIGACLESGRYMSNRIVIPVINIKGEIVGFTGRTLNANWKELKIPKWKHSLGSWVSHNLFNINFAAPFIKESGIVILCEGPLDVLRLEQAGIHNGVAILGKKFYTSQMTILVGTGATQLLDALDNDAAGRVGSLGVMKTAKCLFDVERVKIPDGRKDIGEMSIEEIKEAFDGYEVIRN